MSTQDYLRFTCPSADTMGDLPFDGEASEPVCKPNYSCVL